MSDAAPAAGAAGSAPANSAPNQSQSTASERSQGGSSTSKPETKAGPGTERAPQGDRSASADKDGDAKRAPQSGEKREAKAPVIEKVQPQTTGEKHKVKVDGKEFELTLDELKRGFSHSTAANERMRQAAPMIKAMESLKGGDPGPLVDLIGLEAAEELAEAVLQSRVEWDEMSPEQQELERLRRENQGYKSKEQEAADREKAARMEAAETEAYEAIESEVADVLSKAGRKSTPRMIARAVEYMLAQLDSSKGQKSLSAAEAYERVSRDMSVEIPEFLEGMSAPDLLKHLPASGAAALRAHWIEEAKAQDPFRSGRRDSSNDDPTPGSKPPVRKSLDDWFADKERQLGGK